MSVSVSTTSTEQRLGPPSISRRISIRFLPAPPSERTETLVLNAGSRCSIYTDFRPFITEPSSCEWAFAGRKHFLQDGRCMWTHDVDSRNLSGNEEGSSSMPDIGRSETLPNGDERESGEMLNPETGRVEAYEEVWREEHIADGSRVVALELRDMAHWFVHGVFVRIGIWAQGVVEAMGKDGGVSARRWKFNNDTGRWVVDAAYGADSPMMPEPQGESPEHSTVEIPQMPSMVWEVVEEYTWYGKRA